MPNPSGINALIPLSGSVSDIAGGVLRGQAIRANREVEVDRQRRREREDQAIEAARRQATEQAERLAELESIARGVKKLSPLLPNSIEQVPRFIAALDERIAEVESTGGNARDTREIRELAVAGNFDAIRQQFADVSEMERQVRAGRFGVDLPGPGEDFTLSRGAERRSSTGELIARNESVADPETVVNVNPGSPETAQMIDAKAAATARAKAAVDNRVAIQESAKLARRQIGQVRRFRQLARDTETNTLAPTVAQLRGLANAFGIDVDLEALGASEGLQALAVPFTLQIAQQTKGPISDREMALFSTAVPGLGRSSLGNEFILEGMERISQRQIDIDRLANAYERENGILDAQFDFILQQWEEANPLFDEGETRLMQQAAEGSLAGTDGAIDLGGGATLTVTDPGPR